jgi:hypothetical protein
MVVQSKLLSVMLVMYTYQRENPKWTPFTAQKPVDRQLSNLARVISAQIWADSGNLVAIEKKGSEPRVPIKCMWFRFFNFFHFCVSSTKVQPKLLNPFSWLMAQTTYFRPRFTLFWVSLHLLSYWGRGPPKPVLFSKRNELWDVDYRTDVHT